MDSRNNIRQVTVFLESNVGLDCNVAPDIKDNSSLIEYTKHNFVKFMIALFAEESYLYYRITFYKEPAALHCKLLQAKN